MITCSCGNEMKATKERYEKDKIIILLKCEKCWATRYIELETTEHFVLEKKLKVINSSSEKSTPVKERMKSNLHIMQND